MVFDYWNWNSLNPDLLLLLLLLIIDLEPGVVHCGGRGRMGEGEVGKLRMEADNACRS